MQAKLALVVALAAAMALPAHAFAAEAGAPSARVVLFPALGGSAAASTGDLTYGGGSIQKVPKVYLVFWAWHGADPAGEAAYLESFFQGVGGSGWSGIQTQYTESTRGAITNPAAQLAGTWRDDNATLPATISDAAVGQEALNAAAHFGYDRDADYIVATPSGSATSGFGTSYCAWHTATTDSQNRWVAYTNLPYIPDAGSSCGKNVVNAGSAGLLDGVSIVAGHEYAEAVTDPVPASGWVDASGNENGDKCAWIRSGQGAMFDLSLPTGSFAVQSLYSNDIHGCATGVSVPGAPASASGGFTGRNVTLNWTAPASDGGLPITGYAVCRAPQGNATCTSFAAGGASARTWNDSTYAPGTTYTYEIQALNALGAGAAASVNVTVPGAASAPLALAAAPRDTFVALSWQAPASDGGTPVTGYRVLRTTDNVTFALVGTTSASTLAINDATVAPKVVYTYRVAATTGVGPGANASATTRSAAFQQASGALVVGDPAGLAACDAGDCAATRSVADGTDAHVLPLRWSMDGTSLAWLNWTSSAPADLDLVFYADAAGAPGAKLASGCANVGTSFERCAVPAGAKWVSVEAHVGAQIRYELALRG